MTFLDNILFCLSLSLLVQMNWSSVTYKQLRRDQEYDMAYDLARPIHEKFQDVELTDHVFPIGPPHETNVTYMDDIPVWVEDRMPHKVLRNKPKLWWNGDKNKLYTLFFTGLEHNRTFERHRQYQHWLVVDIPGIDVEKGQTLIPYLRAPGKLDDMYHMFVLYIFEQKGPLDLRLFKKQPYDLKQLRKQTVIAPFVYQHNMTGPISGTFFFQWN